MTAAKLIPNDHTYSFIIEAHQVGLRLDAFLSHQFPAYSRTFLQKQIKEGAIVINESPCTKPSITLKAADRVAISFISEAQPAIAHKTVELPVEILFLHEHFIIINKPAGLMTHAAPTATSEPSLVDWIMGNFNEIKNVGTIDRPGIVHRLDKETSGVMVLARTNYAQGVFTDLFKNKTIRKTYRALVEGAPKQSGTIDLPIGRHPVMRHKMHAFKKNERLSSGPLREAITHYAVLSYFDTASLIEAKPVTGRTHQIRVHMAAIGHPLLGDQTYGKKSKVIKRHALHAHTIEFTFDGVPYSFSCNPPDDFENANATLNGQLPQ